MKTSWLSRTLAMRGWWQRSIPLAAFAVALSLPSKALAQSDPPVQVPILWCVLKGTDLATVSDADRNKALRQLHELPSDRVFISQANVTLRSELVWNLQQAANFKVIDDTDRPPGSTEGDIATQNELQKAVAACRKAYEPDRDTRQVALQGITALYVRRMLYIRGSDTSTNLYFGAGYNGTSHSGLPYCFNPPTVTKWVDAYLGVEETVRNRLPEADRNEFGAVTFLAHEFGHTLSLRHGNGKDDTANNSVDEDGTGGCGFQEEKVICNTPSTIMNASFKDCLTKPEIDHKTTFMRPEQSRQLHKVALAVPGRWPSGIFEFSNSIVSDYRSDSPAAVPFRQLDLVAQTVAHDRDGATTSFIHRLDGSLSGLADSELIGLSYVVFVDLDGDGETGGSPSSSDETGFDTDFVGAELVAQVRFEDTGPEGFPVISPVAHVWKFDGDGFTMVTDDRIALSIQSAVDSETGVTAFDTVQISIPDELSGPPATPLSLQAMSIDASGTTVDRLPDDRSGSVNFWLVPARYPECTVSADSVAQGQPTSVTATFPLANTPVHVALGADQVAEGMTDGAGVAVVPFSIPLDAQTGPRLVTVGMGETALTADCSVVVHAAPDCSGAVASPALLWPPNHKFVDVSVLGVTDADGDPVTIEVTGIRQDEPLRGAGSGNKCPDGKGVGTSTARVRAERAGTPEFPGDGRVYRVRFGADDGRGGTCSGSVPVCIPHGQNQAPTCVDEGELFDATGPCLIP